MVWHYFEEAIRWVGTFCGLLALLQCARQGQFRRIWNWPMRTTAVCWLLFGLLGWAGAWLRKQPGSGSNFGNELATVALIAFNFGVVSLCVFIAGFLITMLRDSRPENRPAPIEDEVDKMQNWLIDGQRVQAIELYQKQNNVSAEEAEEVIDAMDAALQAGLRV